MSSLFHNSDLLDWLSSVQEKKTSYVYKKTTTLSTMSSTEVYVLELGMPIMI